MTMQAYQSTPPPATPPESAILAWARSKCDAFKTIAPDYRAVSFQRNGEIAAAVFYDDFRGKDCNISVLIDDRRVVSRATLREAFWYPFGVANLRRVTARVNATNLASLSLIERLGFQREGVRRAVYDNGADEIIYGMLRENCRWLTLRDRLLDPHTGGAF